ncbi:ABC transporter permease [Nakamurella lactea]|uniref:ABC transporter permease n=1 Tax=Nakamurella lactea TaxID=459515 RepID=UPI00040B31FB|nr:ABC transporter permease [Nakamurella lactea]
MRRLVLVRLAWAIPILFGVSIVSFLLVRALPGDFAEQVAGTMPGATPEMLDQQRKNLGLDGPIWQQYWSWLTSAFGGDLGTSFATNRPVTTELFGRLAVTAELTLIAAILALLLGGTTGLISARLRGKAEWIVRGLNGFLVAVPNFVVATLIVLLAGLYLPQLSVFGFTPISEDLLANIGSLLLPALSLALAISATISENTRAAVLEVSSQDFVMVARAKGLRRGNILRRYLIKNSMTPVITVAGLEYASLLGGSIVVESIFNIPGMGQLLFDSVTSRDYPVIQGIVLLVAVVVVLVNVAVDIAYARVDARVSYE